MRVAIQQVKDAQPGCGSAGNTGGAMAMRGICLKPSTGIDRPAIAPQLPNTGGATTGLDLGLMAIATQKDLWQICSAWVLRCVCFARQ